MIDGFGPLRQLANDRRCEHPLDLHFGTFELFVEFELYPQATDCSEQSAAINKPRKRLEKVQASGVNSGCP